MWALCPGRIDRAFCDFLAHLDPSELDQTGEPRSAAMLRSREESVKRLCEQLVAGQRGAQLASLGRALDIG